MQHVFWLFGRQGSGKTTLSKKIEKHLENDLEIQILDSDEIISQLGDIEYWKKNRKEFMKRLVELAENSAKENNVVIVAVVAPKQKFRDIPREFFGTKYHEIYLRCSIIRCAFRKPKSKLEKIVRIYRLLQQKFETPQSPDIIIDTDKHTIDESVRTAVNFIRKTINEDCN